MVILMKEGNTMEKVFFSFFMVTGFFYIFKEYIIKIYEYLYYRVYKVGEYINGIYCCKNI